jgi:hypothetical protein
LAIRRKNFNEHILPVISPRRGVAHRRGSDEVRFSAHLFRSVGFK